MDIFKPIQIFADVVTYNWLEITDVYWGSAVNFFVYDIIKIGLLLLVINYVMAITRYYFPIEKVRDILARRKWYGLDYLLAALLGVITPFCSCSSIPLFIGFVSAGIPLGVTFAFLIASPLVNEASLFIFPTIFGLKMTITYNIIGIIIAMLGGMIIGRLKMDKHVNPEFLKFKSKKDAEKENGGKVIAFRKKISYWWKDGMRISISIFPYVLIGVGVGALIHGFVPKSFVENSLALRQWWSVPMATILGIPLYANSISVIPIVEALTNKGVPLGTAIAFMTATVTLSIPSVLILKKMMNWQLLLAFLSVTSIGIMIIGYVFNWLY
ncbi:MAG: permease [Candidatus Pacebacteria bacterium]|nr:permease [Candidatus Paceibacterota bacterium]